MKSVLISLLLFEISTLFAFTLEGWVFNVLFRGLSRQKYVLESWVDWNTESSDKGWYDGVENGCKYNWFWA